MIKSKTYQLLILADVIKVANFNMASQSQTSFHTFTHLSFVSRERSQRNPDVYLDPRNWTNIYLHIGLYWGNDWKKYENIKFTQPLHECKIKVRKNGINYLFMSANLRQILTSNLIFFRLDRPLFSDCSRVQDMPRCPIYKLYISSSVSYIMQSFKITLCYLVLNFGSCLMLETRFN